MRRDPEPAVMHHARDDMKQNSTKKLWIGLGLVLTGTFLLLGLFGREVYRRRLPSRTAW
jgi:hypothetical protein